METRGPFFRLTLLSRSARDLPALRLASVAEPPPLPRALTPAQQMMEKKLYDMAKSMEDALDDELHRMNNMDQDDLENIRRKRLEAMKGDQDKRKKWLAQGHGELRQLQDEKEFFSEMKGEDKMVVHFYRNNWPCKVMDMHLDMLSKKHLETKFAKIDAEKSPFLTERLKIWMLPTLALISKEKVLDYVVGFDDLVRTLLGRMALPPQVWACERGEIPSPLYGPGSGRCYHPKHLPCTASTPATATSAAGTDGCANASACGRCASHAACDAARECDDSVPWEGAADPAAPHIMLMLLTRLVLRNALALG